MMSENLDKLTAILNDNPDVNERITAEILNLLAGGEEDADRAILKAILNVTGIAVTGEDMKNLGEALKQREEGARELSMDEMAKVAGGKVTVYEGIISAYSEWSKIGREEADKKKKHNDDVVIVNKYV